MSYANGTTHYNLPLTTGSDKRDWADTNQAFTDVDAALHGAVQDTAQAELDIDALETRMDTAEQNISTNTGNIAGLDTRVTTVEGAVTSLSGQVTDTRQDLEDMICAYNEASATSTHAYAIGDYFIYNDVLYKATQAIAIGDTIVPDTNCSTTNVATELLDIKSDLPAIEGLTPETMISANIEATSTASSNYDVDDYVILNDVLYRVILSISQGAALIPDTNIKQTTIVKEISGKKYAQVGSDYTGGSIANVIQHFIHDYLNNVSLDDIMDCIIFVGALAFTCCGYSDEKISFSCIESASTQDSANAGFYAYTHNRTSNAYFSGSHVVFTGTTLTTTALNSTTTSTGKLFKRVRS